MPYLKAPFLYDVNAIESGLLAKGEALDLTLVSHRIALLLQLLEPHVTAVGQALT